MSQRGTYYNTIDPIFHGTITAERFVATVDGLDAAGDILGYNITTNTNPALSISLNENGIYAGGTNPNVDISLTTQGTGAIVIDGIAGGGLSSQWRTAQAFVQTLNGVQTTLFSIPLADSEMVTVTATVNALRSTFNQAAGGTITISAYRPAAGNITAVGMVQANFAATAAVVLDADVNIPDQSVRILVTGIAAETWNWVTTYSYMYTAP